MIEPGEIDHSVALEDETIAIPDFEQKEARVKQFVQAHASGAGFGLFNDEDKNAEWWRERVEQQTKKLDIVERVKRIYLVNFLKRAGIERSGQLVSLLEHNVVIEDYRHFSAKNLAGLVKHLDPDNEQVALEKLDQGLKRFAKLNLLPNSWDFQSKNFSETIVTLVNISEQIFQDVVSELDQYKFLYPATVISSGNEVKSTTQVLVDVFKQGGLTQRQKSLLEQEQVYFTLIGQAPILSGKAEHFPYFVDLDEALNLQENHMTEFYPYLITFADTKIDSSQDGKVIIIERSFLEGLEQLRVKGKLSGFKTLLEEGWDCKWMYEGLGNAYSWNQFNHKQVEDTIDKVLSFSQDPDKVAWAKNFHQAIGESPVLVATGVDLYEAMYLQREEFRNFTTVLKALSPDYKLELKDILKYSDGRPHLDYNILSWKLSEALNNRELPSKDQQYPHLVAKILSETDSKFTTWNSTYYSIKAEYLPIFAYIASVKDQLEELAPYGYPNAKLVEGFLTLGVLQYDPELLKIFLQLCTDPENLPASLAWQYLSFFRTDRSFKVLNSLPEDFTNTLPLKDQQVINIAKQLPGYLCSFLLEERDKVSLLLLNGRPTAGFLDLMVSKNLYALDNFLNNDVINTFTPEEKHFWQSFKNIPMGLRGILYSHKDNLNDCLVDGKPTVNFLNEVSITSDPSQNLDKLLANADIASFPIPDRDFWNFYKESHSSLQLFLLRTRDRFSTMVVNGQPTSKFLDEAASLGSLDLIRSMFQRVDWISSPEQKAFWDYYIKSPDQLKSFIYDHKNGFSEFVVDGKETTSFYKVLASENFYLFIQYAQKEQWKLIFGDELINKFLEVLPKISDERRNAFTHNEYDRTSQFLNYLIQTSQVEFGLNQQDFEVLTEYVKRFGFSRTPTLFHYFKSLYLFDHQKITQLPQDIEQLGIRSVQEMVTNLQKVRKMVYSETLITDLTGLTPFEIEMLKFITGKSTHRWDSGRPSIEQIIRSFQTDTAEGSIQGLPQGYQTEVLNASSVRIEFNAERIREDYEILKNEILSSIQDPQNINGLKGMILSTLQNKITEIGQVAQESVGKKLEFMIREAGRLEGYISQLDSIKNLDSLMSSLLEMNFDKTEQRVINTVFRRIIFSKVFQKHFSPGFIQEIQRQLQGELSASSIESIINVVDEMAKTHALNLDGDNKEGYWNNETFAKIKGLKRGRDLPNSFSPHVGKLREEVQNFVKIQTGSVGKVKAIPDRGFVGEMAGYLADVCYTAEYPLLKDYPNVIPYKFVTDDPETGESKFIGSVLVFELSDNQGNQCLLVRAFDVPQESTTDIDILIEQFLDVTAKVGKQRGRSRVLIPGNSGAISNYQMTINHMRQNYVVNKTPIQLAERFNFNGYDLTRDCYVVREIAA